MALTVKAPIHNQVVYAVYGQGNTELSMVGKAWKLELVKLGDGSNPIVIPKGAWAPRRWGTGTLGMHGKVPFSDGLRHVCNE